MTPDEKSRVFLRALVIRLRADLDAAEAQATAVIAEIDRDRRRVLALAGVRAAAGDPEPGTMAFVSLAIDRAYTVLESGFAYVAREIDGAPPVHERDGGDAALLHEMILPIQDRRRALLAAPTAARLEVLRRHRHWLRHAYTAAFSWAAMQPAVRALPEAVAAARRDVEQFIGWCLGSIDDP